MHTETINCPWCRHEWEFPLFVERGVTLVPCPKCNRKHPRQNDTGFFPYLMKCSKCTQSWDMGIRLWNEPVTVTCSHCGYKERIVVKAPEKSPWGQVTLGLADLEKTPTKDHLIKLPWFAQVAFGV